jgi:hypothetical protein
MVCAQEEEEEEAGRSMSTRLWRKKSSSEKMYSFTIL